MFQILQGVLVAIFYVKCSDIVFGFTSVTTIQININLTIVNNPFFANFHDFKVIIVSKPIVVQYFKID